MRVTGWQFLAGMLAAEALFTTGCTVLLDHDANKGLGPPGCFSGTPSTLDQFLNRCGRAETDSTFDNCQRLAPYCTAGPPNLVDPPDLPAMDPVSPGPVPLELCQDPVQRPQVVFINGSSNFIPLLQRLAGLLDMAPAGLPKITPVFQQTNSCAGIRSIYGGANRPLMKDPPLSGPGSYAFYYPTDGSSPQPCSLGPDGVPADIGESEIFASSCDGIVMPPDTAEYFGPIESMVFAVPIRSTQTAITAEAAHQVFGLGGSPTNKAAPWTDPDYFFVRNANTATQQMMAHVIGVSAAKFWGRDQGGAQKVANSLKSVPQANQEGAIGIMGTDFYEKDTTNLKALAFQGSGQLAAYWPDSTPKTRDKRNVRDGHYPIWGPLHFFTAKNQTPAVQSFLAAVSETSLEKKILDAYVQSSFVPDCAMRVSRVSEDEDLKAYPRPRTCNCYFEASVPGGTLPPGCQTCGMDAECPDAQTCNVGYCE